MLTGKDVHRAMVAAYPYLQPNWDELPDYSQSGYDRVARELNSILEAQQVSISAVRCPQCNEMLQAEHAEGHVCWLEVNA
jgi:hypothetical protein